ncbi:MAG: hypothetical protein GX970_08235 [Phyllobacteriaceae bacterium]|nr:hypothetical protein [Phyllobacteriaceae bacterium]
MKFLALIGIAATALSAEAASPPDYSGPMEIGYLPIMCLIPPCPPGHYAIRANGEIIARGDVVNVEIDGEWTQYRGTYLDFETITGDLWIGGDDKTDSDGVALPEGVLQIRATE